MNAERFADSDFLRACRSEPHSRMPVWFMRQAGRSLPEYRALRGSGSILEAIADADRAAEITIQPVSRYGVDAAILFSDIVVPLHAVGFGVDVVPGTGPVVEDPLASRSDLARLRPLDPEADTPYVIEAVGQLVKALDVPLIGFAGAPFTLASYLVEGGPSRHHARTKALMASDTGLWHDLMNRLADIVIASLLSQVRAGAAAVQLFDSWAGVLSADAYRHHVAPHSARVLETLAATGVPRIHFAVGAGELLHQLGECGADVVGVDFRVRIDEARRRVGPGRALQGNLDPALVLAGAKAACEATREVLAANAGHPGFVFNLGHGVLPESDPDVLAQVVQVVHEEGTVRAQP